MMSSSKADFVELVVTCGSWQEAQKIADQLLADKLVACVEFMESNPVKLIMESVASNFDKVEATLKEHHSYETFVLQMIPIAKLSSAAAAWLTESTQQQM